MKKVTSKLCMTKDVGIRGNLFGGIMMSWVDEAAAIYAMQITGEEVVSIHFSEMYFRHPVKAGEIIEFYVDNLRKGNTSVSFSVSAMRGKLQVFSTDCTFVAVDSEGKKKKINWQN